MVLKGRKNSSLRTIHYSCCQRRQHSPSGAWASGNFAAPLPHFGGLQLPKGLLQRASFFWWAIALPFACNMPRCHNSSGLEAVNMAAKPQFTSAQQCSRQCRYSGRLFFTYGYTNMSPTSSFLQATPPPGPHLGSGRRPEKVHCTELQVLVAIMYPDMKRSELS